MQAQRQHAGRHARAAACDHWPVHVDAGIGHTIMLTEGGRVFSCGHGGEGQLGLGDTEERSVPTEVAGLGSQRVVSAAAGGHQSFTVSTGGAMHMWGMLFEGDDFCTQSSGDDDDDDDDDNGIDE